MAKKKITGTGKITESDYKVVRWVGKTKGGQGIEITLNTAINLGNTELVFADKNDTVSEAVFTAVEELDKEGTEEPWSITYDDASTSVPEEILLGAGKLYINEVPLALTRGGGKFNREASFREIEVDGQRGPTKGLIDFEGVRATLSMSSLQILTRMTDLYTGMKAETV